MPIVVEAAPIPEGGDLAPGTRLDELDVRLGSLVLNQVDADGVVWVCESLDGWEAPAIKSQVDERLDGDGAWAGPAFLSKASMTLNGAFRAPSADAARAALVRLSQVAGTSLVSLSVQDQARTVRRSDAILTSWLNRQAVRFAVGLEAPDPLRYSLSQRSTSTGVPATSGGLTFPVTLPFTIDATFASGAVTVQNLGNHAAPVTFEVTGPVSDPSISLVEVDGSPRVLSWGLDVTAGQTLVVSPKDRTALIDGQSRIGSMTSRQWFTLPPGLSELRLGGSGSGTLTVRWRDAWA